MQDVLASLLLKHAPLATLIVDRVHWDALPPGLPQPSIVMFVVSGITDYTMARASGYVMTRVQFDCRGATAASARAVAEALEGCLSGFRGSLLGYRFQGCFQQGQRTRYDKDGAATWFTDSRDFAIHWALA